MVRNEKGVGYIDKTGKEIIPIGMFDFGDAVDVHDILLGKAFHH